MRRILIIAAALLALLFVWNSSLIAGIPENGSLRIIAHRGIHQTFSKDGVARDTCTASRIDPVTHDYIENTIPSIAAAFAAGADVVEIDIAPTSNGQLAVFHDWTIDCRTDGSGDVRDKTMAELRLLDIGYGYTADDGTTYPLRGKGQGLLVSLDEILANFPDKSLLLNFKSNDAIEADMILQVASTHPENAGAIWAAYGAPAPVGRFNELFVGKNGFSTKIKKCLVNYLALGWSGYIPEQCRNTRVMVPSNLSFLLWGWPNRFTQRMNSVDTEVILIGPYAKGDAGTSGIDTPDQLSMIPTGFDGYIWTNRAEVIAPLLRSNQPN